MKKRVLSVLCALALCFTLFSAGFSVMADSTEYVYTMLQDFESANAGSDCQTFGQHAGHNALTYANVKNGKMVEVTVGDKTIGDNFYPALAADEKDWNGYDGLVFYYAAGECPTIHSGGAEVGRFDINLDVSGVGRLTASNTVGPMYFLEDGTTSETTLLVGGDQRYIMPNKSGYVRMPFSSLNGWTESTDLSSVEMFIWIATDAYAGNHYRFDDVKLYKDGDTDYKVLQEFSSANIGNDCYTFSQFQDANPSAYNVLTYASIGADVAVSGNQYSHVTVSNENAGGDNFYPFFSVKDWSNQDGVIFYYAAGNCPNVYSGGAEVGRMDFTVCLTNGTNYTASNNAGKWYFLADGATAEVEMYAGGDMRYLMPNQSGYVRIPFTSLVGWSEDVDMSSVREAYLWITTDSNYVGNNFYFDAFQLYAPAAPTCEHEYTYPCDAHCALCGELTNPDAAHNIVHVDAVDKTCTENGNIEYWY
ncbi:MAG: hypothetical protein IJ518_07820, partial [Clostridia bacterium]|nr:hypothetical protein [Clostridia bacterium]